MAARQRRSLYPPERPRKRERYYFDDTLDAYPPYHLLLGPSTPEEVAAARAKALKRGLLPRTHPAHPEYRPATADDCTARPAKTAGQVQ
jgi:hypothetical protein